MESLNTIQDLLLLVFANQLWEQVCWAIATQMADQPVLATVQGYPALVPVGTQPGTPDWVVNHHGNWTAWLALGCYTDWTENQLFLARLAPYHSSIVQFL